MITFHFFCLIYNSELRKKLFLSIFHPIFRLFSGFQFRIESPKLGSMGSLI